MSSDRLFASDIANFWIQFPAEHWQSQSTVVPGAPTFPCARDAQNLFELLLRSLTPPSTSAVKLRLLFQWPDGRSQAQPLDTPLSRLQSLPNQADRTLENYHQRIMSMLPNGASGYSLVVNNLIAADRDLWFSVRRFIYGLSVRLGIPTQRVNAGLMIGRYFATPFRVHIDRGRSAFIFPIVGEKRYRIWPERYVEAHPELKNSVNYAAFVKDSECFELGPGEVMYWPPDSYHVAEGGEAMTAMLSIGVFSSTETSSVESDVLGNGKLDWASLAAAPPAWYCEAHRWESDRTTEVNPRLAVEWLERLSRLNLKQAVPKRVPPLPTDCRFRLSDPAFPVLWSSLSDGHFVISANGYSLRCDPAVESELQQINAGKQISVDGVDAGTRSVVHFLWQTATLEVVEG